MEQLKRLMGTLSFPRTSHPHAHAAAALPNVYKALAGFAGISGTLTSSINFIVLSTAGRCLDGQA